MFQIPTTICDNIDDYVSYRTTTYNGAEPHSTDHLGVACYAKHMTTLGCDEYTLYPNRRDSILPKETYFNWVNLCKSIGLIPTDAVPDRLGPHNTLFIPRNGYSKHQIYAAMCCYRWSENQSQLVYVATKAAKTLPVHFGQALHYAAGTYITLTGHSFCNIVKVVNNPYAACGKSGQIWLPWSIGIKEFFRSHADKNQSSQTDHAISEMLNKMDLTEPGRSAQPELCVPTIEDVLWKELADLYEGDMPPKAELVNRWKKVMAMKKSG